MAPGPHRETESEIPEWVNPPSAPPAAAGDEWEPLPEEADAPPVTARPGRRVVRASTLDEWERVQADSVGHRGRRRSGRGGRRILVGLGVSLLAALAIAVGVVLWVNGHLGGSGGAPVDVTLPDQASHATLASDLTRAHVVSDGWLFRRYLDYRGTAAVQGGRYTFHLHEGYRAALHDLGRGPQVSQVRFTVPEGFDLKQIAALVGALPGMSSDRFLTLATSGAVRSPYEPPGSNNLEGLLFPDTYFISPKDNEQTILQRMVDRFAQVADASGLANSMQTNGLQPYQTVILASLVEKEAKIDADRGKIAQVILNRLAKGMKLQIDATVEYAEGVHKTRLLNSDLRTQSPYNTYLVAGLPPGPIGGPGRASLDAALNPTTGPWLYYVLIDPSGAHAFATTSAEFQRLKEQAHAKGLL